MNKDTLKSTENFRLTEREQWVSYWKNADIRPSQGTAFEEYFSDFPIDGTFSVLEIGGFPGKNLVYFKRRFPNCSINLLDYFVDNSIIKKTENINGLPVGTIRAIEADLFDFQTEIKFDVVTSFGFIEHFEDTKDVLERHIQLLKPGGELLVTLPNFLGLNGWVQKKFDPENYRIHNLKSMNLQFLESAMKSFDLENLQIAYDGIPNLWLEPNAKVSQTTRLLIRKLAGVIRRLPVIEKRWFLPYIVISGKKPTACRS
jgi:SAM-dependent methyltransferase